MKTSGRLVSVLFILIFAFAAFFISRPDAQSATYAYHLSYSSVVSDLTQLATNHSSIAKMIPLSPVTYENRVIWAIKISDNVNSDENENRVLYLGTHHAREWISTEVAYLLANYLVTNYDTDSTIKSIIDNEEIWIVPVTNPDGYQYTTVDPTDDDYRQWRKNRVYNSFLCSLISDGWGVDLNRNYGSTTWGTINDRANSHSCLVETYIGPSAFSERETQAVRDLMTLHHFDAVLSYHSFGQRILYPWGNTTDHIPSPDYQLLTYIASKMDTAISGVSGSVDYLPQQASDLYPTAGDLTDWSYESFGIPSFTIELRPCITCNPPGFELPPDSIEPTWNENKPAAIYLANFFNLRINSPTQVKPAFAGEASEPIKIRIVVNGVLEGKSTSDFSVTIGGIPATVITASRLPIIENGYELQVQPPTQSANGTYDLVIEVGNATSTVVGGVIYGQTSNVNVVLVIDRSGSMSGQPITDAKIAASQFVNLMNDGDKLAVVSFSSTAIVDYQLTTLDATEKLDAIAEINEIYATGNTSIGAGLQAAGLQLTSLGDPGSPWAIVLLSDGQENTAPYVATILPTIKDASIKVYTIGLGSYVSVALLENIAYETGGIPLFAPSSEELVDIYNLIAAKVTQQQTILSETRIIQQDVTDSVTSEIDSSINEVTFSITWGGSTLGLQLISPSGVTIDPTTPYTDPNVQYTSGPTYSFYRIRYPEPGSWTINITGIVVDISGYEPYTTRVTGVTELTMDTLIESGGLTEDPIAIITTLADGLPIINAAVTAQIYPPAYTVPIELSLFDDGAHNDGLPNDGIYSNIYYDTLVEGTYDIITTASGISNYGEQFTRQNTISISIDQRPVNTIQVIAPPEAIVLPGETIVQTFTVVNTGNVLDTYQLVAGPWETDQWADLSAIPDTISLNPGSSMQVSIPIYVPPAEMNPDSNLLVLQAISQNEPSVLNTASTLARVLPADLYAQLTGPTEVGAGQAVEYVVSFGNSGPASAGNIVVAMNIPVGMEFIESTFEEPVLLSNGSLGWFLPSLSSGASSSINISLQIQPTILPGTTLPVEVGISSGLTGLGESTSTPDLDHSNNTSTIISTIFGLGVQIDIKPSSTSNSISLRSASSIPVAILSTDTFDAPTQLVWTSLTFGKTGYETSLVYRRGKPLCSVEDVNGDSHNDLVCNFTVRLVGFSTGDTLGTLRGQTINNIQVMGTDQISIRP